MAKFSSTEILSNSKEPDSVEINKSIWSLLEKINQVYQSIPDLSGNLTLPGPVVISSGLTITLGGLTIELGGATITGDSTITGDLVVTGDVYTIGLTDYSATSTIVGWTSYTTKQIFYKKVGKTVTVYYHLAGTSNSTSTSFTVPFSASSAGVDFYAKVATGTNNGTRMTSSPYIRIPATQSTVTVYRYDDSAWTASGTKMVRGQFTYETS